MTTVIQFCTWLHPGPQEPGAHGCRHPGPVHPAAQEQLPVTWSHRASFSHMHRRLQSDP